MAETPLRHFRCDDETWSALERIGKELERTQSWLARKAVEQFIERHRAAKREQAALDAERESSVAAIEPRKTKRK